MKILIASDWYKPTVNGVVTSIVNLKSGLEAMGHEVRVLTLSRSGKSYREGNVYYVGSLDAEKIYPDARIIIKNSRKEVEDIIQWKPDFSSSSFCSLLFLSSSSLVFNLLLDGSSSLFAFFLLFSYSVFSFPIVIAEAVNAQPCCLSDILSFLICMF